MNRVVVVLMMAVGLVWGCGQDKYADVVEVNDQFITVTQDYVDGLNKAQSGKDVAKVMNKYADEFKKLAPKMNDLNTKYPDLAKMKDLPEKIKISQEKAGQMGAAFASSFMKSIQYMGDPEVVAAQERMAGIMQSVQPKN